MKTKGGPRRTYRKHAHVDPKDVSTPPKARAVPVISNAGGLEIATLFEVGLVWVVHRRSLCRYRRSRSGPKRKPKTHEKKKDLSEP